MIDVLVDIVAGNGCMLLDLSPEADGTIPAQARQILLAMGDWLRINGEAIYGTRPWTIYGEGPSKGKRGGFSEGADKGSTSKDIRFTTKGKTLYAIALDWPKDGKLLVTSLARPAGKIDSVRLLGSSDAVVWSQQNDGLLVTLPAKRPCDRAFALKVEGCDLNAVAHRAPRADRAPGASTGRAE
jgi:alpha-L-fucosidase